MSNSTPDSGGSVDSDVSVIDSFPVLLNNLLVHTFRSILKAEQYAIQATGADLSISEMHLIESASRENQHDNRTGRTIKDMAEDLEITMPSVTVAVNKLVKKGYLEKVPCTDDGRKVYVMLTEAGQHVNRMHSRFHESMINRITGGITEQEKMALVSGVGKIDEYFSAHSANAKLNRTAPLHSEVSREL